MKNNKSFIGKLITFSSFLYILYITMKERGYWDEMMTKIKEEKQKWKEKYNKDKVESEWYTIDADEVLRQRFASGEIDEEEYKTRMEVLKRLLILYHFKALTFSFPQ